MTDPKDKHKEIRRHKRLPADYLVRYVQGGGESTRVTNIKNLSAGGAKFLTGEVLNEEETIEVTVLIPPLEKTVKTRAKVLRLRRTKNKSIYSVAVRFTDIDPGDQRIIDDFVESLHGADRESFLNDLALQVVNTKKIKGDSA